MIDPYDLTVRDVEKVMGGAFETMTRHACHSVSLALVKAGLFDGARVARGFCEGVGGQHSWVAIGDPYHPDTVIVDATWWSYKDGVEPIYVGTLAEGWHHPHGQGSIWDWGRPEEATGEVIELTPTFELSYPAQTFLELLGPLDRQGWAVLSSAPVEGWPAGEIFAAMDDTKAVKALVKIDILGMTTDRNPGGLYLPA